MHTRQCVGIVLRRIRGGVKGEGGNIKRERWTQGNVRNSTEENKRRCER